MKFEFCKKRRRKQSLQYLRGVERGEKQRPEKKRPRYFEQEYILGDLSKQELEEKINGMLEQGTEYGDIAIKIDWNIHILRRETTSLENKYYVKVIDDKDYCSNEKVLRTLKKSGEVSPESTLIDIVFWEKYRVLLFRK